MIEMRDGAKKKHLEHEEDESVLVAARHTGSLLANFLPPHLQVNAATD